MNRKLRSIVDPAAWSAAGLAVFLPLALPAAACGEGWRLRVDPEATAVTFTLGATLHQIEGSFRVTTGEIRFDPSGGEASGRVVIDVASGETGNQKRDREMHREVLESDTFPEAVLTVDEVGGFEGGFPPEGSAEITLRGSLTLHGEAHPLSLRVALEVEGDRLEASTGFAVPYVEWGMKDPSKFVLRVEKHVDVTLNLVGKLER